MTSPVAARTRLSGCAPMAASPAVGVWPRAPSTRYVVPTAGGQCTTKTHWTTAEEGEGGAARRRGRRIEERGPAAGGGGGVAVRPPHRPTPGRGDQPAGPPADPLRRHAPADREDQGQHVHPRVTRPLVNERR